MFAEETPELLVTSERILVRYGDGVETSLPAGVPFSEASCTCGASSVCRHRVGLVLVYRANHGSSFDHIDWTPGEFDDEALEAFLGAAGTGTGESDQAGRATRQQCIELEVQILLCESNSRIARSGSWSHMN